MQEGKKGGFPLLSKPALWQARPMLTYVSLNTHMHLTHMHHTHDTLRKEEIRKRKEKGGIGDTSRCHLHPGYTASPEVGSDNWCAGHTSRKLHFTGLQDKDSLQGGQPLAK